MSDTPRKERNQRGRQYKHLLAIKKTTKDYGEDRVFAYLSKELIAEIAGTGRRNALYDIEGLINDGYVVQPEDKRSRYQITEKGLKHLRKLAKVEKKSKKSNK